MHSLTLRADAPMRPYENQGPTILASTLTVTIVAVLTTIARFHVRINMIRNMGWDCIAGQCTVILQVVYGAGKHIEYIDPHDFSNGMKLNFISQPVYLLAICSVKLSVGLFLLRIAVKKIYRCVIIGIMVFMTAYTIASVLTILLQCTNIHMMWDPTAVGKCWTLKTIKMLGYLNICLNISTDIAFSIPMLWGVQMNRRHKASLICILSLGTFATAAALVKLSYLPTYGRSGDLMWDSRNLTMWTVTECNVGIIAGNLPCLKPLFRSILVSTYGGGSRKNSQPKYFSRSYASGTKQRSVGKSYDALEEDKVAGGGERLRRGDEAYALDTIDVKRGQGRAGGATSDSASFEHEGSTGRARSSNESVARLHSQSLPHNGLGLGLGKITVTRNFDVTESVHSLEEGFESGGNQRTQGLHAKELV
ncbi:integral membrane [Pyrenophora seminiperda CCB06]|uniref:Integral membrane n=1 Tax=Pyrenophora seminiperda CCB06 TaxID=1302712 RepID=A0A3M7LZM6_9PLEO|nr:integral membrane [Pyrenophora seminiperda CCB06]